MIRAVVIAIVVVAAACAQVTLRPPRPAAPVLLNQYDAARVMVYHDGSRCRVFVATATTAIETSWTRCNWITQP